MDLPVARKNRIPRNVQKLTGYEGVASGSGNPSGTNEGVGQGRLLLGSAEGLERLLPTLKEVGRTASSVSAEKGKGKSGKQPMNVSVDEEGSKEYVCVDAAPNEATGMSAPVVLLDEEDNETKIQKLSLAFKQEKAIYCKWRDGTYRPAKVLEIKEQPAGHFKYYVHYIQFDRRNDEWVDFEQLKTEFKGPVVGNMGDTRTKTGVMTRRQKRQMGITEDHDELELDEETRREHEAETKVKKINKIRLRHFIIKTWYYTPLPSEYDDCEELFFCEFCLTFLKRETQFKRHMRKECNQIYPNGKKIYASGQLTVFEVDGTKQRVYAENLCYLAKMFLDHKSLLLEVAGFLFYILCEKDMWGFHILGYFSKEKFSEENNILACILTLPPYQKKGYGNFMIGLAYELAKREGKIGRPEHPISDMGKVGFRKYYTEVLLEILSKKIKLSIKELSKMTHIHPTDIVNTLKELDLTIYRYGEHILHAKPKHIESLLVNLKKSILKMEPEKLEWKPSSG